MAKNPTVVDVRPDGEQWQVRVGESPMLVLQSKQTAVAEAHVQAMLSQPSQVVVHAADGTVEERAGYPADSSTASAGGVPAEGRGRRARPAGDA